MDLVLLSLGAAAEEATAGPAEAALAGAGARVEAVGWPRGLGRPGLDAVLDRLGDRRLVIAADVSPLAAVLRRLMRRGELARVETAVLPIRPVPFLARHGIRPDLAAAARVAVEAACRTVGVLKDDSGDVVVDRAELRPWAGRGVWVRAYVDDERLCDGEIAGLRVERGGDGGLRATVTSRGLGRKRTAQGRALQLACDPAALSSDGAPREQPRRRRTWWDEPGQWRLAVGAPLG